MVKLINFETLSVSVHGLRILPVSRCIPVCVYSFTAQIFDWPHQTTILWVPSTMVCIKSC